MLMSNKFTILRKTMNKCSNIHFLISLLLLSGCIRESSVKTHTLTLAGSASFHIGSAIEPSLMQTNSAYANIVNSEFNSITGESAMKFDKIEYAQNSFDFSEGDWLVNYAQQHKYRVHGHTLIWQDALPNWVLNFQGDSSAWENIFKTYITTVVSHYKGKVASWDVVNEAIRDDNGQLNDADLIPGDPESGSVWCQHLGQDYIARAFQYAHTADPDALLFYNDFGNDNGGWNDQKLDALINLVTGIKKRGIQIDGIGIQMHINLTTSNSNITSTLQKMAATGLKIHISELDIAVNPNNDPSMVFTDSIATLQSNKYQFIAETYRAVIPVEQQYGITMWEFSDANSWIPLTYNRKDWPLPFDANYKKKPAYYGFLMGLTD